MISARLAWAPLLLLLLVYPVGAWLVLRFAPPMKRDWMFALTNVLFAYAACVAALVGSTPHNLGPLLSMVRVVAVGFFGYLLFVMMNYWLLRGSKGESRSWGTAALWFPIVVLILIKYVPSVQDSFASSLRRISVQHFSALFLGLSYLTFRLAHLVQEVRNEVVEMPTVSEYLSFSLFMPTLSLGPINPYSKFIASYRSPDRSRTPIGRSLRRILLGLTKYLFLGTLLSQYTYSGLLFDGHPHARVDIVIAIFAYTLFLYCNFSGFCDMVIGVSGLLGIEVMENFNVPFIARNLQEFWNRWHISLSTWLRDMMFTPLVKVLARIFGPKSINHVIAFSVFAVFVVIGVWHGVGINFALFGMFNGIGLAVVHYYSGFLKKRLGKKGFESYRKNRLIHAAGCAATFVYFSLSLFLFANTWEQMQQIGRLFAGNTLP